MSCDLVMSSEDELEVLDWQRYKYQKPTIAKILRHRESNPGLPRDRRGY